MSHPVLHADLDRCTGCFTCVVACKEQNQLPAGMSFIRLLQVGPEGDFPEVRMHYLPLACQQCARPACADSCPEDAIVADDTRGVVIDGSKCTGCGDCVTACPYGAVSLRSSGDVARKCELCGASIPVGGSPACVAVCPAKALRITEVAHVAAESDEKECALHVLRPDKGTEPRGRFVLTRQRWCDLC